MKYNVFSGTLNPTHFTSLLGRPFIVRTDHAALQWLRKTPEPIGQQSRWLEVLEEFHFTVEHRPVKSHANADALSRRPCRQFGMCTTHTDALNVCALQTGDNNDRHEVWYGRRMR